MEEKLEEEQRADIKELLSLASKTVVRLDTLNGSVAKIKKDDIERDKKIVAIQECIKYNKGVIIGAMTVVSMFWTVIQYLK